MKRTLNDYLLMVLERVTGQSFHDFVMETVTISSKSLKRWWARQGLNLRPHPCEGCALPLSYAPVLVRGRN
jgi:hypothetical protein